MSPVVSVIVPVFNLAPYLHKCLSSIAAQSLREIEVLVIDDGSTDDSLAICRAFAAQDARFRVVTKPNEGQGVARNLGLDMAQARYVAFVDGDDWIEPGAYADCAAALDRTGADFVNFGLDFVTESGQVKALFGNYRQSSVEGERIVELALLDDQIFSSPCNKLYRRATLEQAKLRFPPVRACEDIYFSRALALVSVRADFTPHVYYHALVRAGSTTRGLTPATLEGAASALAAEREFFTTHGRMLQLETRFRAHVLKLFAYLLLLAAFRAADGAAYRRCLAVADEAGFGRYARDAAAVALLPTRSRLLLRMSCSLPGLLRASAQAAKRLLRWTPY